MISGDCAYANSRHVVTTYPATRVNRHSELTDLNERLAGMRQIVENVFGRLKSKFSFVRENNMLDLRKVNRIIHALCIVYNMQTTRNDPNLPSASQEIIAEERSMDASSYQESREEYGIEREQGGARHELDDPEAAQDLINQELSVQSQIFQETSSNANALQGTITREYLEKLYC